MVIGGGLAGLSAALHLLQGRPGRRLVLLEADGIGHGASGRSTGMLTPGVGQDLAALIRRVGEDRARATYLASLRAVRYAGELASREGIDCQLRMTGQLVVAWGRSGRARLRRQGAALAQLGLPCEPLDDQALAGRIRLGHRPAGTDRDGPAALRLPVAGLLHPGLLLAGLAQAVRRAGGVIHESTSVAEISQGRPARVALRAGGEIIADDVVVATNGYSQHVGLQRGRVLPVHLRVLLTRPLTPAGLAALGWGGREGVIDSRRLFHYFRLTEDHRVLFGGGVPRYQFGGGTADGPPSGAAVEQLAALLRQTLPRAAGLVVDRSWTGVIGYVLDTLPVIQRQRTHPAVVFVGGWCGHGIALSLLSGAWVADLIDREARSAAVIDREARSAAVIDREARSAAVIDREARSAAVTNHDGAHQLGAGDLAVPADLPWFRDRAPLLPLEPLRWLGVPIVSRAMAALDRL